MKKRFKQVSALILSLSLICPLLAACGQQTDEYPFSPLSLEKRFGDSMDEVIEDLGIDLSADDADTQSNNDAAITAYEVTVNDEGGENEEINVTVKDVAVDESGTAAAVILRFYRDVFYSAFYSSENVGYIYDQTIAMYELCNDKYGEEMNDENLKDEPNIARRNFKAKPTKEEFLNPPLDDVIGYNASWWAKNRRISKIFDGEPLRFDITASSWGTDLIMNEDGSRRGGNPRATLGMGFNELYFPLDSEQ
jgi:hypothetical protein